jgi:hypothetical protein
MINFNESESLKRPAWTQNDLYAFKHKRIVDRQGRSKILYNYYVLSKGEK